MTSRRRKKHRSGASRKKKVVDKVRERDGRRCRYCGGQDEPFEIDHVVPICAGGSGHADNLVVSCRDCNQRKGGRTPEQAGMALLPVSGAH